MSHSLPDETQTLRLCSGLSRTCCSCLLPVLFPSRRPCLSSHTLSSLVRWPETLNVSLLRASATSHVLFSSSSSSSGLSNVRTLKRCLLFPLRPMYLPHTLPGFYTFAHRKTVTSGLPLNILFTYHGLLPLVSRGPKISEGKFQK